MTAAEHDRAEIWRTGLRWYVHIKAANGRVIESPGQGYLRRSSALRALRRSRPDITDVREITP
jgi:hypothetical protein